MTTEQTAKMTHTPYFIEYASNTDPYGKTDYYYQLVRKSDLAILYANASFDKVLIECWRNDIRRSDVSIW